MDGLVNPAAAQILANQTENWANQDVSHRNGYNQGYEASTLKSNAVIDKWKAHAEKLEEERDVAQAGLEANLFSSREKSKLISELKGVSWQQNWNDTIHKPAKDKIYFAHLKAKGYKV